MDWHKKYSALVNVSEQTLEFTTQGQWYRTIVEYKQEAQVNNLECFWTEIIDIEEQKESENIIAYLAQPEEEEEKNPFMEEKRKLLALFPSIVFQNKKSRS